MKGSYELEVELQNSERSVYYAKALLENGMFGMDGAITNAITLGKTKQADTVIIYLSHEGELINIWEEGVTPVTIETNMLKIQDQITKYVDKFERKHYAN